MSQSLQELSTVSIDEEDRILAHRTELAVRAMLSVPQIDLPSSREETRVRAIGLAERIRELEARRVEAHTWELIHVLSNTKAAHALLKWRLFPINELPVEILQRIFALVVSSLSFSDMTRSRTNLVSVCSYWRSVAIDTAKLWSIIPINTLPPFHLLNLCLRRARAHSLVLFVDQRDRNWSGLETDHRFSPDDMRALMLFVASFLDQVRQLVILADTWAVIVAAQDILQSVPPPRLLQHLQIHRSGNAYVEFVPPATPPAELSSPFRLFGGAQAPMLEHLSFDGVWVDFSPASFRNLRVFEMRKMPVEQMPSLSDFLPVLQGSPLLERLAFDGACPQLAESCNGMSGLHWQPVQLIHLREFTICNLVPDYAAYVLQLISAPGLRRLTLEKLLNEDFTLFIEKLIDRFPKVTVLTVNGLGTKNTGVLVAWLRTMPIRYLRVARVAEEFFEALLVRVPVFPVDPAQREQRWSLVCPQLEACEVLAWPSVKFAVFERFCSGRMETLRSILISQADLEVVSPTERAWLVNTRILNQVPLGARPDLKY